MMPVKLDIDTEKFAEWFKSQFAVFILLFMVIGSISLYMHMIHDKLDESQVAWMREYASGFKDALLGALSVGGIKKGFQMVTGSSTPPPVTLNSPPVPTPAAPVSSDSTTMQVTA